MKKTILFASALFAMLLTTTTISGQVTNPAKDDVSNPAGGNTGGDAGKDMDKGKGKGSDDAIKCCPAKLMLKDGKILSTSILKGTAKGVDLTFDILDANGKVEPDGAKSVSKNASGDLVIDGGKLKKGKHSIRFRAGKATQSIQFAN